MQLPLEIVELGAGILDPASVLLALRIGAVQSVPFRTGSRARCALQDSRERARSALALGSRTVPLWRWVWFCADELILYLAQAAVDLG